LELLLLAAVSAAVPITSLLIRPTGIVGLYHDDGIYLSTAQSLAERGEYRLIGVPSEPYETKYPPFYPGTLALVLRFNPHFPDNIRELKSVNTALLVAINVMSWLLLGRLGTRRRWWRLFGVACVATCPVLFGMNDILIADPLMIAALLGVILNAPDRREDWSRRQVLLTVVFAVAATLARVVGASALGAIGYCLIRRRQWRLCAVGSAVALALLGPWLWWRGVHHVPVPVLLRYYVEYEPNAMQWLFREPMVGVRILVMNPLVFAFGAGLSFGVENPLVAAAFLMCVLLALSATNWPVVTIPFVSIYSLAICTHPFPLLRYLAPLAPIAFVAYTNGAASLTELLVQRFRGSWIRTLSAAVLSLPIAYQHSERLFGYLHLPPDVLHVELGLPSPVRLPPLVETANWLRDNSSSADRIAARHDPYYFLYCARQGIRPWEPHPETYTSWYGVAPSPPVPADVMDGELRRLGITILIDDQGLGGGENAFADRQLHELLGTNTWKMVFETADGRQRVYRRAP
jgi:MFS family permease